MSPHATATDLDDDAVAELTRCEIAGDCPERWTVIVVGSFERHRWFYRVCDAHYAYLWAGSQRQGDWTLTHRPRAMVEQIEAERAGEVLATIAATLGRADYILFLREQLRGVRELLDDADGRPEHRIRRWQREADVYSAELSGLGEIL